MSASIMVELEKAKAAVRREMSKPGKDLQLRIICALNRLSEKVDG